MPSTPTYGLRYQSLTDPPDGATLGLNLATDVEAELVRIENQVNAGQTPGGRIATGKETTDSANFTTTETSIVSVAAPLVNGATYRVTLITHIGTTVAGDLATVRIRENTAAGTEIHGDVLELPTNRATGYPYQGEEEYTAVATATKTFHGTAVRTSGSGSLRREGATTRGTYLYVDYIRG